MKLKKRFVFLLIITIMIFGYLYFFNVNSEYNEDAITVLKEYDLDNNINDYEYSKTLEEALLNDIFDPNFFEEYTKINYLENEDFLNLITIYLNKDYTGTEINYIFELSNLNQEKLLKNNYIDFTKYKDISNYDVSKTNRYNEYLEEENLDIQTTVTYVNINADLEDYTDITTVTNPSDLNVLLDKHNKLPSDYVPDNLVTINGSDYVMLTEETNDNFNNFISAAKNDGLTFIGFSGYRSYTTQENLYNNYSISDGIEEADTYSARAGHSEHQLGTTIDVQNPETYYNTGEWIGDEDYEWILENAHKYGFIVRYPKDSTYLTGYIEEPWHLRYFGIELATKIVESKLTYDEYYDLYIKEY